MGPHIGGGWGVGRAGDVGLIGKNWEKLRGFLCVNANFVVWLGSK